MMDESSAAVAVQIKPKHSAKNHRGKGPPICHPASTSLVDLCRSVITANLERYPPESFGICDPAEWQALVLLRHARTQPKKVIGDSTLSGGLDGTGRLVPALSEKVLHAVEECNPHLAQCKVADTLLWKDCVEYRFRRGGLTRPEALHLPWPLLVEHLLNVAKLLHSSTASSEEIRDAINTLRGAPMNVNLLKDSGVGKTVKKAIKKPMGLDAELKSDLNDILSSWMEMAETNGVVVNAKESSGKLPAAKQDDSTMEDLQVAETCQTWRQLFAALQHRNEELRTTQGKRMREIRKNLARTRPKLVKVRPSSDKQQRVLDRSPSREGGNAKVAQIRKESSIQTMRQRTASVCPKPSFGDAVAFAAVSKKGMANKRKQLGGTIQQLTGGKRMKVPTKVVQGAGPRQFASKWKTTK